MLNRIRPVAAFAGLVLVAGCTSGNGALEPGFTSANLNANKVELAVGIATFSDGSTGLNVVATARQKNGLSATLLNTPTLTGPFTVPAGVGGDDGCATDIDGGTSQITGSPQTVNTPTCTTFGEEGGVFSYGFAPENSTTSSAPSFALYGDAAVDGYGAPFFGNAGLIDPLDSASAPVPDEETAYRGGPPAYPNVRTGAFPSGFYGYTLGYTTFSITPVAGVYNLSINIPSGNTAGATLSAPAFTLASTTGLPAVTTPATFTEDGTGAGTETCVVPAGATETLIELYDYTTSSYYTYETTSPGTVSYTFSDSLGESEGKPAPTLNAMDSYEFSCISADYPLFEAGVPQNTSQTPTLVGMAGQTDIEFSPGGTATYGVPASTSTKRQMRVRKHQTIRR